MFLRHGKPEYLRSDNGPEFIAHDLQGWLRKVGIKPIQIYPGSPWEKLQRTLQRYAPTRSAEC
jgi:transposase InsO family protein